MVSSGMLRRVALYQTGFLQKYGVFINLIVSKVIKNVWYTANSRLKLTENFKSTGKVTCYKSARVVSMDGSHVCSCLMFKNTNCTATERYRVNHLMNGIIRTEEM
jgi:hypothetical protein